MNKRKYTVAIAALLIGIAIATGWVAPNAGDFGIAGSKGAETFGRESPIAGSKGAETFGRESS